mmetsp:Transcript_116579/g.324885  ORF Transcript_116579/g.324885 Transcript_116579/m.324885 type:complete len:213 (+) Transcript_116579:95-733(+)
MAWAQQGPVPVEGLQVWSVNHGRWLQVLRVGAAVQDPDNASPAKHRRLTVEFWVQETGLCRKTLNWGSSSLRLVPADPDAEPQEVTSSFWETPSEDIGSSDEDLEEIDPGVSLHEKRLWTKNNPFCLPRETDSQTAAEECAGQRGRPLVLPPAKPAARQRQRRQREAWGGPADRKAPSNFAKAEASSSVARAWAAVQGLIAVEPLPRVWPSP